MKEHVLPNGYVKFNFSLNNKKYTRYAHRLVAEAFIPNQNNYPQVNHKDENKRNNSIDNLEWCTAKYNNNYGTARERVTKKLKEHDIGNHILCVETNTIFPSYKACCRAMGLSNSELSRYFSKKRVVNSIHGYHFIMLKERDVKHV